MRILDRYLVREFLIPFFYCLAAFLLVYVIYDLSAHLDEYIEYGIPLRVYLQYYATQLPLILVNVIPLAILLAIIYCLSTLARHNEITAMRASGISIYRIMFPFFLLGVLFTLVIFFLNENFAPRAYAESERLIEKFDKEKKHTRQPLAFYNPVEKRTWSAQWEPGSDTLYEVSVRILRNRKVTEKLTAEKARFLDGEWWFFDGTLQRYGEDGLVRGRPARFNRRRFPFKEKPEDFLSSQKDSQSMTYAELKRNMAFYPRNSDTYVKKLVDLDYKVAFPFVGITIVLIAVPLAIRTSRGGAAGSVGVSIALVISYYALGTISLAMGRGTVLWPWLAAWLPNIVFGGLGAVLIYRSR